MGGRAGSQGVCSQLVISEKAEGPSMLESLEEGVASKSKPEGRDERWKGCGQG